jgi:VIT1/CCC1 family predicted Fe2+/Mn2+ transporter
MKHSIEVGLSFGLTSGVITTIGLMVGVYSGTNSSVAVIASVLTIAIADAMSDALGIHIAEESENVHTQKEVWISTLTTFFAKFLVSSTFLIPLFLIDDLKTAVIVNIAWGTLIMVVYNYFVGKKQVQSTWGVIAEHLFIAFLVVLVTYYLGVWVNNFVE